MLLLCCHFSIREVEMEQGKAGYRSEEKGLEEEVVILLITLTSDTAILRADLCFLMKFLNFTYWVIRKS